MAQDLNPSGACGDANLATAEKGRALVEHLAGAPAGILEEATQFPLSRPRETP